MARWDIFISSNTLYPGENLGFIPEMVRLIWFWSPISISRNNEWKIDILFHSLLFSTLKYDFFSDIFGDRSGLKLPSVHAPDIFLPHAKNRLTITQICGP